MFLIGGMLAVFALRVAAWRPLDVEGSVPTDGYTRVAGVIHVHTTLSDGGGTPEEVIRAAQSTGLGFVVITDHNNADAKSLEGYHDGVLVIVGSEVSTTAGHILGLGIAAPTYRFSGDAQDGLDDIADLGGFAVAAHPFSPRQDFRFEGFDLPGDWGLELINGDSEWRGAGPRLLSSALVYGLNQRRSLLGLLNPPDEALRGWDALLAKRHVVGLAGADAHSRLPLTRSLRLRFPSYEAMFALLQNHVLLERPLTGQFEADRASVLEAIQKGRVYVGLDGLAPARAFSFVAESSKRTITMGGTIPPASDLRLRVSGQMPASAVIEMVRDGAVVATGEGSLDVKAEGPGVYRVQVRVSGSNVPWLLSNPIYVFDDAVAGKRAARAIRPAVPEAPAAAEILADFEQATAFQPGADPQSTLNQKLEPGAGEGQSAALRLDFRLAEESESNPSPFVATVDWTHRDLKGRTGLVFSIRGDAVYRTSLQVRDANPASRDEGTEWWFGSVRTSTSWQRVFVPFARLRSINPQTDGRLDLDQVRALVFVMDRGALLPGTKGTIWLDDIGVY